jgi:hypothetical protein
MTNINNGQATKAGNSTLHLLDGSTSLSSYAAIARRGNIFLGIKFSGLVDGSPVGAAGKSYLHVKLRSARNQDLATKLDQKPGVKNVINLSEHQLALDKAWPKFAFENIDGERASLTVGMFIDGSLDGDTHAVIARIKAANLFLKLVNYAIDSAGAEYRIAPPKAVAAWLAEQAKAALDGLAQMKDAMTIAPEVKKEFEKLIGDQVETVGPHLQQLKALYLKHQQAHTAVEKG